MKRHPNPPFVLILLAWLLAPGAAAAVERTETVECALADGSHFVLSARHDWAPYAVFARHAADRMGQTSFQIDYRLRGATALRPTGDSAEYQGLDQPGVLEALCAGLGLHRGQPGTGSSLRMPGEQRFWVPQAVRLPERSEMPELKRRAWHPHSALAALAVVDGALVREVPLLASDADECFTPGRSNACVVQGALQWVSRDRGVHWDSVTIETAPRFYKTGLALAQQPGVARPSTRTVRNFRNREAPGRGRPCPGECTP